LRGNLTLTSYNGMEAQCTSYLGLLQKNDFFNNIQQYFELFNFFQTVIS